jgi:hypothetical protein
VAKRKRKIVEDMGGDLQLGIYSTQETIVEDQIKTKGGLNAISRRKWVTQSRSVEFDLMIFLRESSKTNQM